MITLESVLLEADKVEIDATPDAAAEEDEDTANDYTDTGDEEVDVDQDANDDESEDAPAEDDNADDADMGADDEEGTDYTEEDEGTTDDDGTDDSGDDTADTGDDSGMDDGSGDGAGPESEEQLKERDRKVKQYMLLKELNRLYHAIKEYTDKVANMDKKNVLFSAIQKNVTTNFKRLSALVYNYIMFYYDHMSYEYNLYVYNYFVETCKVNIELMNKIVDKDDVEYS